MKELMNKMEDLLEKQKEQEKERLKLKINEKIWKIINYSNSISAGIYLNQHANKTPLLDLLMSEDEKQFFFLETTRKEKEELIQEISVKLTELNPTLSLRVSMGVREGTITIPKKEMNDIKNQVKKMTLLLLEKELGFVENEYHYWKEFFSISFSFIQNKWLSFNFVNLIDELSINELSCPLRAKEFLKRIIKKWFQEHMSSWINYFFIDNEKGLIQYNIPDYLEQVNNRLYLLTEHQLIKTKENFEKEFQKQLVTLEKSENLKVEELTKLREEMLLVNSWSY